MLGTEIIRNGKSFDSGDVDFTISGVMFPGVIKLEYGMEEDSTVNYSLKRKPTSWGKGKVTFTKGAVSLYMEDAVELQKIAGGSVINLKPFFSTATITNDDGEVITDVVYWKFKNDGRSMDGGTGLKMDYDMLILDLKLGV